MWRVGQHNECVCMRHQTFSWECCQVCCSWKIVLQGVYSRQCPDVLFNEFIDFFSMCMWTCWHASVHMFLLLHVCVSQALLILWMWIHVYLYCTSAGPADCSTSSQVMWNVSGTEHRMCSSGPQRAVRTHTHSLSHSVIYMPAHSFLFPPSHSLLSSPLPVPLHCSSWHNGPIIVPFSSSVSSAHSVFV